MKYTTLLSLFFGLLAISLVTAEDRTRDPNDPNLALDPIEIDSDDSWRVNLVQKDTLTNEDFNVDIKIEHIPQDNDDFDDHHDSDDDLIDDDNNTNPTTVFSDAFVGQDQVIEAQQADRVNTLMDDRDNTDFNYDLIRKEIIGEAHKVIQKIDLDDDDDDTDIPDVDYTGDVEEIPSSEEKPESVDDDLKPDNGQTNTQISSAGFDEIEDSDDGDNADIVEDDEKIDYDYMNDDDSGMADDDYLVNGPTEVQSDDDSTVDYDDDDDGDSDGDDSDDFLSQGYIKYINENPLNFRNFKLNVTTVKIVGSENDDSSDDSDLAGIYYKAGDDDSDSDYDIYDRRYQEENEKGNFIPDEPNDSTYDYDIFIDIDDSIWDTYLANDAAEVNDNDNGRL